jgi:two-component system alkaline phosphatase synthesis response regulator PhoP
MDSPMKGVTRASENRPPRVLIADDTPPAVELLEEFLDGTGCEVRAAYDGEETLKVVAEWHPDLILLDIMMPKISGFEVCKRLRSDPATQHIGILMVTALDQPSDIDRAVEVGAHDYLPKPINKRELLIHLHSLLQSRHQSRELEQTLAHIQNIEREGQT